MEHKMHWNKNTTFFFSDLKKKMFECCRESTLNPKLVNRHRRKSN